MADVVARPILSPFALTRTGNRAARVGTFALETWSRLLVDGRRATPADRARELSWVAENACAIHGVRSLLPAYTHDGGHLNDTGATRAAAALVTTLAGALS